MNVIPRFSDLRDSVKATSWWRWLIIALIVVFAGLVIGTFFVKRQVVVYRQEHRFGVRSPAFFGSAHALSDPLAVDGNRIELLHNGDQIFPAMLAAIAGAKRTVNFETFILHSGEVGSKFRDAFAERARAGVKVRVLLDGLGSSTKLKNEDVDAMKRAGVEVEYYHPGISWRLDKVNRRTHRRVLVIDGKIGFTGGVGFADEWKGNADSKDHWRDIHARVEGPIVTNLQGAFQQHWVKARKEALGGDDDFPALQPAGQSRCGLVASHSFSVAPMPLLQAVTISSAEQKVWIANAYFWPARDQIEQLAKAARRGVDVRLLVPGPHNDQPISKAGGRQSFGDLLKAGVRIFEYQPTMMHAKTMVADGIFSVLGSSNLDARSTEINEELDLTVYDEAFAAEMERVFEKDLTQAKPYTLEDYNRRSLKQRLTEQLVWPFRSQM